MVLELHIWGPAFGLPSTDAQCLATIAYFLHCLKATEWRLIPSSDPSACPTSMHPAFLWVSMKAKMQVPDELPALHIDSMWICGFHKIVDLLRERSFGRWDLDQHLTNQQRADCAAFSSFLESRGQPLLDLSLYVSSENYTEWTRPALAQILQWPQQWFVPHRLRDEAKIRSEHLGLSSLDIDTLNMEHSDTNFRGLGSIPTNLLAKPKNTVAGVLGRSGGQNQFRLDAVTSDVLEPLCELVEKNGSHSWVFGTDQATSLDCLLLGHMSLMVAPLNPPQQWLQDALSSKFPALLHWTTSFRQECFGGPIGATDILMAPHLNQSLSTGSLPWQPPAPVSITGTVFTVVTATFHSLSTFFPHRSDRIILTSSHAANAGGSGEATTAVWLANFPFYGQFGVSLGGSVVGAVLGYLLWAGRFSRSERAQQVHTMPRRQTTGNQRGFGEAGRILGLGVM